MACAAAATLLLAICASQGFAQEHAHTFTSADADFLVSVPAAFEVLQPTSPEVALLMRSRARGYPTFNVLVHPGSFFVDNRDKFISETLASYRKVGLIDARLVRSFDRTGGAGVALPSLEIGYTHEGIELIATVGIASGVDRHFTLTYIDRRAEFAAGKETREQVFSSFSLKEPAAAAPAPETRTTRLDVAWIALAILAAALAAAWRMRAARRSGR